tara:strand:- start:80 stop:460 length:381 start_codon:yes stop_codon:yes gene_type:complete
MQYINNDKINNIICENIWSGVEEFNLNFHLSIPKIRAVNYSFNGYDCIEKEKLVYAVSSKYPKSLKRTELIKCIMDNLNCVFDDYMLDQNSKIKITYKENLVESNSFVYELLFSFVFVTVNSNRSI